MNDPSRATPVICSHVLSHDKSGDGKPMPTSRCVIRTFLSRGQSISGLRSKAVGESQSLPVCPGSLVSNVGCIAAVMRKCDAEVSTTGHYALPFILSQVKSRLPYPAFWRSSPNCSMKMAITTALKC